MNKLTKLLSVFVIAGAVGASVAGVAACKKDDGDKGGHKHSYTQVTSDTEHPGKHILTCPGCEDGTEGHTKTEDCVDEKVNDSGAAGEDGLCDKCNAEMPTQEEGTKVTAISISTEDGKTTNVTCKAGESVQLKATVTPSTATEQGVTWSLHESSQSKATISPTGLLSVNSDITDDADITVYATTKEAGSSIKGILTVKAQATGKFEELSGLDSNILSKDFEDNAAITEFGGTYGTQEGVYYKNGTAGTISVSGGKVVQAITGGEGKTIVDFGAAEKDIIEGYAEVTLSGIGNSWSMIRLVGTDGTKESDNVTDKVDEVFSIRTDGGNFKYRLNKGALVAPATVIASADGDGNFYFKYNKISKALTVEFVINNQKIEILNNVMVNIDSVKALEFVTGSNGSRAVALDCVAINNYVATETEHGEAKTACSAAVDKLETEVATLKGQSEWTNAETASDLTAAKTAADFTSATTATLAKGVYDTYKAAVWSALTEEFIAKLQAADKYPATNYTTGSADIDDENSNLKKYNDALAKAYADLGAVKEVADFTEAYNKLDAETFAIIPTNSAFDKPFVNVSVSDGTNNLTLTGELKKKAGMTLTVKEILAAVNPGENKIVYKLYSDAAKTQEITETYLLAGEGAATDVVNVTVYTNVCDVKASLVASEIVASDADNITSPTGDAATATPYTQIKETKFYTVNDSATSSAKTVKVEYNGGTQRVNLGGKVAKNKSGIATEELAAGKYVLRVKYFNTNAGRYVKVIDTAGKELGNSQDKPTTADGAIVEAYIEVSLTAQGRIIFGSGDSGLYLTEFEIAYVGELPATTPETPAA